MSIPALKRAVNRLIKAEVAVSWLGAQNLSDREPTKRELILARKRYEEALAKLRVEFQQVRLP